MTKYELPEYAGKYHPPAANGYKGMLRIIYAPCDEEHEDILTG